MEVQERDLDALIGAKERAKIVVEVDLTTVLRILQAALFDVNVDGLGDLGTGDFVPGSEVEESSQLFGYVLLSVEAAVRAASGFLLARRVLDVTLDLADHFRERLDFGSESVDVGGDLFDGHDACWCSA